MQGESPKLRLLAYDVDDVAVLSALLQDAIIPGSDMSFDRQLNEFVILSHCLAGQSGNQHSQRSGSDHCLSVVSGQLCRGFAQKRQ